MAEKKVTKKDKFYRLLDINEVAADEELREFVQHEIELLEGKSGNGKPTKTQEENAAYAEAIIAYMEPGVVYQVAELAKNVPELAEHEVKSQRVTPMLTALVRAGRVTNFKEKGKSYYTLAEADAE